MRAHALLLVGVILLSGFAKRSIEDVLPSYSKAYDAAFERLGTLGLADTQTRIKRMGEKGKAFEKELEELQRRQHEVNDLIVKSVLQKKQAQADKKPDAPEVIEAATRILVDADAKAVRVHADITRFNERLTAAGAPVIPPSPPRDSNARD